MKRSNMLFAGLMAAAVAGCGGGSGSGAVTPSDPVAPATPVPTVSLSIDTQKVALGQSAKLTWSSANATSCTASGSWSGAQTTSGTANQTPAVGGQMTYTLTCTGAGGTGAQSVALAVPLPVLKSSYENKIAAGDQTHGMGLPNIANGGLGTATAFADFFQEGAYSMVSSSLIYDPSNPATMNKYGGIYFYKKDTNGKWVDHTSEILKDATGCLHPRKALVADFNGDGKPDVYFACHGFDAPPFPGEKPHILLSQPDGTYKNVTLPITCYCHSATAADLNGDGKIDLIISDTSIAFTPYVLINNGDGTAFTPDFNRIPAEFKNKAGIYSLELIDIGTGKYDLFIGSGTPPGSDPKNLQADWTLPNGILKNDGLGTFLQTPLIPLPNPAGSTGIIYGLALDFVVADGYVYYHQINNDWDANNLSYSDVIVRKTKLSDFSSTAIYEHFGKYSDGTTWFPWLVTDGTAVLKVQCNSYIFDQSKLSDSSCGVTIKR